MTNYEYFLLWFTLFVLCAQSIVYWAIVKNLRRRVDFLYDRAVSSAAIMAELLMILKEKEEEKE